MKRPLRRDGPALPSPTRLLFLAGASAERDASTLQQLSALTGQVQVTTVGTATDVEQKIRSGGYHALVVSHAWPQAETLSLISSLRKSNAPIAIVPVVTETQRDLYASAVAVGADDVLILLGGTLLHPTETLVRVRQSRYLPAHEVEAVRAAIRGQHAPPAPTAGPPPPRTDQTDQKPALPRSDAASTPAGPPAGLSSGAPRPSGPVSPPAAGPPAAPPAPARPSPFATSPTAADHDAVRRDLERRLGEAELDAASRHEAHAALVASRQELERAVQAHAAAKEAWDREREKLLTDARSAAAATTLVEDRLQAALADVERLSTAHASAEAAWKATQQEWEASRTRANADRDAAFEQERRERQAVEASLASERAGWEGTRQELEQRLQAVTALAASRDQLEHAVRAAETALRQATEAHAADRRSWEIDRQDLDRRLVEAGEARLAAESALEEARGALRSAEEARATERDDRQRERSQFEARMQDLGAVRGDHGVLEDEVRAREADLASATAALEAERATAADLRERLAVQQAELDVLVRARDQLEQALDAARADLRQLSEARATEQAEASRLRDQLERALDAARAELRQLNDARVGDQAEAQEARRQLEHALDEARSELRETAAARADAQTEAGRAQDRAEALRAELESTTKARADLDDRLRAAQADLQEATDALAATRAAADAAREALEAKLAETASTARNDRSDLERRIAALGTDLQQAIEAGASDRLALDVATEQLRAQRAEIAAIAAARTEADAALARARADHDETLARESAARQDAEAARQTLDALRSELASARDAQTRADQILTDVRADRDRLAAAHEQAMADAQRATSVLREEVSRTSATVRDLESALADLRADRQRLADEQVADRAAWDGARRTFEKRLEEAEGTARLAQDLQATVQRVQGEFDEARAALSDAQAAGDDLRRQLEAARREYDGAERQLGELERTRDAVRQELDRIVRDHTVAAADWDERQRGFETEVAALHEARATERMDWMAARLALETRLSQADDELDRQREETDTLRAELGRVAARYDRLSRSELFGYGVTTLDGWLVHCNDAFARLLGYTSAREALASASEQAFGAEGGDVISAASLVEGEIRYRDGVLTRVDGDAVRVLQSAHLISSGQDALIERIVIDLGDRSVLEERLREAQRLEALGRLTAAMVPELDALATALESGLSVPADPLDDGADALPAAVGELRQLVSFARKQARPAALLDVNDAMERLSAMLARLVSSHVDFALRLGPAAVIAADEEDFEQVITALVVAARDRLTAGGSLLIETGMTDVGDTVRRPLAGHRSGTGAVLTVTATGYGVQPAEPSATLEAVVARLAGTLAISGTAGRRVTLRVDLPRIR